MENLRTVIIFIVLLLIMKYLWSEVKQPFPDSQIPLAILFLISLCFEGHVVPYYYQVKNLFIDSPYLLIERSNLFLFLFSILAFINFSYELLTDQYLSKDRIGTRMGYRIAVKIDNKSLKKRKIILSVLIFLFGFIAVYTITSYVAVTSDSFIAYNLFKGEQKRYYSEVTQVYGYVDRGFSALRIRFNDSGLRLDDIQIDYYKHNSYFLEFIIPKMNNAELKVTNQFISKNKFNSTTETIYREHFKIVD